MKRKNISVGRGPGMLGRVLAICISSLFLVSCSTSLYANVDQTDCIQSEVNRTLVRVENGDTLFFLDKIPFDGNCGVVYAAETFQNHTAPSELRTDDTERLQRAIFEVSRFDRDDDGIPEGGVLYLKGAERGSNNYFRLARLTLPSNIRIVIDPELTLVMMNETVPRRHVSGKVIRNKIGEVLTRKNQEIFTIGNSEFTDDLNLNPVENVEITSSREGEMFTIDQRTEFPTVYTFRQQGQLRSGSKVVRAPNPQEYGITSEFAAPFYVGYARNVAISDVNILDNYTYLPPVTIYPDADMKDGIVGAERHAGTPRMDENGHRLLPRMLIDDEGNKVTDLAGYKRNSTYGRTLTQGAFVNIKADRGHGGFGLFQIWGGDTIYARDLHGTGGITVRLEPGAGIENISRSGPEYGSIHTIEIEDISIRDGYTALWLNPHSKDNHSIKVKNISAFDSGAAVIMDKSGQDTETYPDLYKGTFTDVEFSGYIHFAREHEAARAEVGFIPTLAMHPHAIANVQDVDGYTKEGIRSGKPDGKITTTDLPAGPSGDRWFLVDPIVPIIAFNQETELQKIEDNKVKLVSGFYTVDFSNIIFTREEKYPVLHSEDIIFRSMMRRLSDGKIVTSEVRK